MDPKAQFTIPQATHQPSRALYLLRGGGIDIARRSIPNMTRIDLNPSVETTLVNGPRQSELLMLQARPIGEPIARHGPFVMNTRDEIVEAYRDYQRTGFGGWPWPNDAPVHGRDDKRFARRPDGQIEEAT